MIQKLFDETAQLLAASEAIAPKLKDALQSRLKFRISFLTIVEQADSRTSPNIKEMWTDLLGQIPDIRSTTILGRPKPESFSLKLQRRLASTVPPRPMVEVSEEAAFDHLERLCKDASVAVEVLKYYDSHSLLVCPLSNDFLTLLTQF